MQTPRPPRPPIRSSEDDAEITPDRPVPETASGPEPIVDDRPESAVQAAVRAVGLCALLFVCGAGLLSQVLSDPVESRAASVATEE